MMTLAELDAALMQLPASPSEPQDIARRAELMTQRVTLAQKLAETPAPPPSGGVVANVPEGVSNVQTRDGVMRNAEIIDGKVVVRLRDLVQFRDLLCGGDGLAWERANPDLMARFADARLPPTY